MKAQNYFVAVASLLLSITQPLFSQLKEIFPIYRPASTSYQSSFPIIERDTALEGRIASARIKSISRRKWGHGLPDKGEMVDSTFFDDRGRLAWTIISNLSPLDSPPAPRGLEVFLYDSADNLVQIEQFTLPREGTQDRRISTQRITYTYNGCGQRSEKVSEAEQGRTEYVYNKAGLLEQETNFDRDGVYNRIFYIYDKGRLKEIRGYTEGEMKETPDKLTEYTYDGNQQTEEIFLHGSLIERHVMMLDKNGRIVERRGYDSYVHPAPMLRQLFCYDKNGSLISETIRYESNPFAPETLQVYTYNEQGFPVICRRFSGKEVTEGIMYMYQYYGIDDKDSSAH
jgi:hypothetical protein